MLLKSSYDNHLNLVDVPHNNESSCEKEEKLERNTDFKSVNVESISLCKFNLKKSGVNTISNVSIVRDYNSNGTFKQSSLYFSGFADNRIYIAISGIRTQDVDQIKEICEYVEGILSSDS